MHPETNHHFAADWRAQGRSSKTLASYARHVRRFLDRNNLRAAEVTREALEAYLAVRRAEVQPASPATEVRALRAFFSWYSADEEVPNAAAKIRIPKVPETQTIIATEQDVKALPNVLLGKGFESRRDRAMILVLWDCGVRREELASMTLDDLDLESRTVVLPRTKNGKVRVVAFSDQTAWYITRYLRVRENHPRADLPWLWLGHKGKLGADGVRLMLARRSRKAGVKVNAHSFRRGMATTWMMRGGSEVGLMAVAGWSSSMMVRRYRNHRNNALAIEEARRLFASAG
jgi:site-specific recombinase XerD